MITSNRLLGWSVAAFCAYWIVGGLLDGEYLTGFASLLVLVFGALTSIRYTPRAWEVVVNQWRNTDSEDGDGSHLAAYGVALFSNGAVYVGIYGLVWLAMGQPASMLSTALSGFGRAMMGAGLALMFFSPDVSRRGLRLPTKLWFIGIAVVVLLSAFFIGVRVGRNDSALNTTIRLSALEPCGPSAIKGNITRAGGKLYHRPGGPYYAVTRPEKCFGTEQAALAAGFRPAP